MYDTDRSAGTNDFLVSSIDDLFVDLLHTYLINPYSRLKDLVAAQTQRSLPLSFCIIYLSDIVIIASTTTAAHWE